MRHQPTLQHCEILTAVLFAAWPATIFSALLHPPIIITALMLAALLIPAFMQRRLLVNLVGWMMSFRITARDPQSEADRVKLRRLLAVGVGAASLLLLSTSLPTGLMVGA